MAVILEARVWTKTDTYEGWMANPLLLGEGEMALVVGATGTPLNMRWGQKTPKRFSELPNVIAYDQGAYVNVTGLALPTPSVTVGYSIVGEGIYTKAGQANVVVPAGNLGILYWNGTTWSLGSSIPLPGIKKTAITNEIPVFSLGTYYKGQLVYYKDQIYESVNYQSVTKFEDGSFNAIGLLELLNRQNNADPQSSNHDYDAYTLEDNITNYPNQGMKWLNVNGKAYLKDKDYTSDDHCSGLILCAPFQKFENYSLGLLASIHFLNKRLEVIASNEAISPEGTAYMVINRKFGSGVKAFKKVIIGEKDRGIYSRVITDNLSKYQGDELLHLDGTFINNTGEYLTGIAYKDFITTDKIPVKVGDAFIFYGINRGIYANVTGIFGYDDAGTPIKIPDNAGEYRTLYVHKDSTISKIGFCFRKTIDGFFFSKVSKNSLIRSNKIDTETRVKGYVEIVNAPVESSLVVGEIMPLSALPITIKMKSGTASVPGEAIKFKYPYNNVDGVTVFLHSIVKLVSIDTAGADTVKIGGRDLNIGDTVKMNVSNAQQGGILEMEIRPANTSEPVTFTIEISSIGIGRRVSSKDYWPLAEYGDRSVCDVAYKSLFIANPYLKGKHLTALGDSIVFSNGGGPFKVFAAQMEMNITPLGLSNKTLRDILSVEQLEAIPKYTNLIFLTGGTNAGYWPTDDIESRDPLTTYGLLNRALDYCYTNMPQAQVVLMTPNLVADANRNNSIRLNSKAMRDIAYHRAVILCDWFMQSGINEINYKKYLPDNLHPSPKARSMCAYRIQQSISLPFDNKDDYEVNDYNLNPIL